MSNRLGNVRSRNVVAESPDFTFPRNQETSSKSTVKTNWIPLDTPETEAWFTNTRGQKTNNGTGHTAKKNTFLSAPIETPVTETPVFSNKKNYSQIRAAAVDFETPGTETPVFSNASNQNKNNNSQVRAVVDLETPKTPVTETPLFINSGNKNKNNNSQSQIRAVVNLETPITETPVLNNKKNNNNNNRQIRAAVDLETPITETPVLNNKNRQNLNTQKRNTMFDLETPATDETPMFKSVNRNARNENLKVTLETPVTETPVTETPVFIAPISHKKAPLSLQKTKVRLPLNGRPDYEEDEYDDDHTPVFLSGSKAPASNHVVNKGLRDNTEIEWDEDEDDDYWQPRVQHRRSYVDDAESWGPRTSRHTKRVPY